jgi:hypothetical protein
MRLVVASTWVGYLAIPDEQVEYKVPTIMPEALEDYIHAHSPVGARFSKITSSMGAQEIRIKSGESSRLPALGFGVVRVMAC